MITFEAARPGAWLREDIADVLTALAISAPDASYLAALCAAAQALGLRERQQRSGRAVVVIDTIGREVQDD